MFAEKYSQNTDYHQLQRQQQEHIIREFEKIKLKRGILDIPIFYLIKTTRINQRTLINQISILIEKGILEVNMFSTCPYCYESNMKNDENKFIKCSHCNELYSSNDEIEKYRIKKSE